ncbi:MAG: iron-sulfur cluster assembly scaffold protein [Candidatus Anstonellales archaeon]
MTHTHIYKDIILEHYKNPKYRGKMKDANARSASSNYLCGDYIEISAKLSKGKVKDIKFEGGGCAISIACADILCSIAIGKTIDEIISFSGDDLFKNIGFVPTAARLKCALLALDTLKRAVKRKN